MEKIRICMGSNDKENIAKSHMGDTENFLIYDIYRDGEVGKIDIRENRFKDLDHAGSDKMGKILEIVNDAEILVAAEKSPNFINIAKKTKYQPVIVKAEKINDVLNILGTLFTDLEKLIESRKGGYFNPQIPQL